MLSGTDAKLHSDNPICMEDILFHLDTTGLVHVISSVISLITGTWIVLNTKATTLHKRIGKIYVLAMTIVIVTSFMIYRLFDGFGIFHGFAILSTIALVGGMLPMIKKNRTLKDLEQHATVMGWSVVGLYCALISEICARIEFNYAIIVLSLGCGLTCTLGSRLIKKTRLAYLGS